ncbi:sporulation YhaL family protein [Bacillus sp. PS06]|uniref:sporulation YhaL family protein n=1 Tax=Bacillus sp. PS06 TaxID=2764176 RepID=UPI0017817357|nr:sporulation YhaL family protein [Bacillus sp. PS06]MBD8067728.1 sporulation YhaL family protein [Bacillus sp. PS06]
MLFATPWWIYLALVGIVFSAYMIVRTSKEEKQVEDSYIEQEGQVYIDRINSEKELRKGKINKAEPM